MCFIAPLFNVVIYVRIASHTAIPIFKITLPIATMNRTKVSLAIILLLSKLNRLISNNPKSLGVYYQTP